MRLLVLGMLLCVSSIQAVQVIKMGPDRRMEAWEQAAKNFGESIGQGIKNGYRKGVEDQQAAREKAILDDILKNYEPCKNSTFVLKVLQSDLSSRTKEMVVNVLNEQHKMHLYEQATK